MIKKEKMSIQENDMDKNLNGAGDCVRDDLKNTVKRIPKLSCKKFNANLCNRDNNVTKRKIKEALNEINLQERAKLLKRKSLTLTDIKPIKTLASGAPCNTSPPRRCYNQDAAGRRVYQRLLLNAWRRRRNEVASLSESSENLRIQKKQLQMQIDVLQQLRQSECKRRSETSFENIQLRISFNESIEKIQHLENEIQTFKENDTKLKEKLEEVKVNFRNITNDLSLCRNDILMYDSQLQNERDKLRKAIDENTELTQKINEKDQILKGKANVIQELENYVTVNREKIQNAILRNKELDMEKHKLLTSLEKEKEKCRLLENQLQIEYDKFDKNKLKIIQLKKHVVLLKDTKRCLIEENDVLRENMKEILNGVRCENEKPWWRNFVNLLTTTAHLILPALPPRKPDKNELYSKLFDLASV